MAVPSVDTNFKTTITFGTTAFAPQILAVKIPGESCEKIATTYQGTTTNGTSMPGRIVENTDLEFTYHYDGDLAPVVGLANGTTSDTETVTVLMTHRDGTKTQLAFTGYSMNSEPPEWDLDGLMTGRLVVSATGDVAVTHPA